MSLSVWTTGVKATATYSWAPRSTPLKLLTFTTATSGRREPLKSGLIACHLNMIYLALNLNHTTSLSVPRWLLFHLICYTTGTSRYLTMCMLLVLFTPLILGLHRGCSPIVSPSIDPPIIQTLRNSFPITIPALPSSLS